MAQRDDDVIRRLWGKPRGKEELYATFRRWFEIFGDVEFSGADIEAVGTA
jgi:hypothetical protein